MIKIADVDAITLCKLLSGTFLMPAKDKIRLGENIKKELNKREVMIKALIIDLNDERRSWVGIIRSYGLNPATFEELKKGPLWDKIEKEIEKEIKEYENNNKT